MPSAFTWKLPDERAVGVHRQRQRLLLVAHDAPRPGRHRRVHAQADRGAAQHGDVAALVDRPRREPGVGRVDELHLHPLDERERGGLDLEHRRAHAGGLHEVLERLLRRGRACSRTGRRPAGATIGTRSNGAPLVARVNRSTSVAVKPCRRAAIDTSEPRATVALPGVTSIRYGLAASAPVTGTSTANAPCRRYAGPRANTSVATAAMAPSATSERRRLWRSRPRPESDRLAPLDGRLHQLRAAARPTRPSARRPRPAPRRRRRSPASPGATARAPRGRAPPAGR